MAPVMHRHASLCTLLRVRLAVSGLIYKYQAAAPYVIMGLIMVVYIHLRMLGLQPQVVPARLLHTIKALVALLTVS